MEIKKENKIISFILTLVLLFCLLPSIITKDIFAENFSNCTVNVIDDYQFTNKNNITPYSSSTKGVVVSSSTTVYERINGESMMNFPTVPYYSIGLNRDEGSISLLPSSSYLKVRYDTIGKYYDKDIGAYVTIKNPVNMTKLVLYSDFWYGCYLLEYGSGYGSADLEFEFFYSDDPNTIIQLDENSYITASSIASWAPSATSMSYEGINFDTADHSTIWIKKDGLIVKENFYNKDLFYCKEDINKSNKYVDVKGDPTYMNCGVMFHQDSQTWKCTPVIIRTDRGYGASWSYFLAEQINFNKPPAPQKTIKDSDNDGIYYVGENITYEITQQINSLPEDGYGKYNKLQFVDDLPAEVDYVSATMTCSTGETITASTGTLSYNSQTHSVTYTFSDSYLASLQYKGQTFKLTINCKINEKASQAASFNNKAIVLVNNERIESNTIGVTPKYKITTEVVNGTIDPNIYNISAGETKTISYKPNAGYMIQSVTVDGVAQSITSFPDYYTFSNISADHHIKVVYEPIPNKTITITKIWNDRNNEYNTRPSSLKINVLQNSSVFSNVVMTSSNAIATDSNKWTITTTVPERDQYRNILTYTIEEDTTNINLRYFYETPIYDQSKLTVTNVAQFIPTTSNEHPEYKIIIHKDIVDKDNNIADSEDFEQVALDINDTYNFAITLKELNRIVTNTGTSLVESYNGYSGNIINGIVTNKGDLIFNLGENGSGKYEISENANQYFDFVDIEKLNDEFNTSGASFSKENGKYYITLSGITGQFEQISVKVTNQIKPDRPYNKTEDKENLFKI